MLQSYNPLCGPSQDSLWDVYVLLVLGSPQVDTAFQTCLIRAEQRGRIISHDVLATFLIMQPKMLLAFLAARACYSLTVCLESTRAPRCFSADLPFKWSSPILYWCLGIFVPRCRTSYFLLLNFMRFLLASYSGF